ncbi:FecR family protein [Methylopila sp. 73B]|uniref:FecR family protein n=1 Tax=Methylopila sp. 73B TaxID=1120792 RepID=UPI00035DDCF2|nr:FecR family protein [Methylopila sp. 73B]
MGDSRATRSQRKLYDEASGWALKHREGGRAGTDDADFMRWLEANPDGRRVYEIAERLMVEAPMAIGSDQALREFRTDSRPRIKPIVAVALALFLSGSLFVGLDGPMRLRADAIAGTEISPTLTLADGTTVQLNASSAIAEDYNDSRRTVRLLRGQAFFDVAPDAARPFTVEAGQVRVTALGTAFDVRRGETETDVTVTHNAVRVEIEDGAAGPIRIGQNEQAVIDHETPKVHRRATDGDLALAWRRGRLVVDDAPLAYVIEEMDRHFSGRILIAGGVLAQRRVSGTIAIADTDASLEFLKQSLGLGVTRLGPLIVIHG